MANNNAAFSLNGYSYADAKVIFDGIELPGVTSFDFTVTKTKTNNYGLGSNPVSRSRGKKEYSGSIEMDFDTSKLLQALSPTGLLTEVPAGILVMTLSNADDTFETITIGFFEFNGDGITGTEGDENLTQSIDVIFGSYIKS